MTLARRSPSRNPVRRTLVGAAVAALTLIAPLVPAQAAVDDEAPVLRMPNRASFVVGTKISPSLAYDGVNTDFTEGIRMRVAWSATDASGICGYDVELTYAGADPVMVVTGTTATSFSYPLTDYDDQFGGGSFKIVGFQVTAHDCAGNTTTRSASARPVVVQENGANWFGPDRAMTYAGRWWTVPCTCQSGQYVKRTRTPGASLTFTAGRGPVALVMTTGPTQGMVAVHVDDVFVGTVDLLSARTTHRVVVWQKMLPRTSTVTVVDIGVGGRGGADLDAVLTTS